MQASSSKLYPLALLRGVYFNQITDQEEESAEKEQEHVHQIQNCKAGWQVPLLSNRMEMWLSEILAHIFNGSAWARPSQMYIDPRASQFVIFSCPESWALLFFLSSKSNWLIHSDLYSTQKLAFNCRGLKWNVILSTKFSLSVKLIKSYESIFHVKVYIRLYVKCFNIVKSIWCFHFVEKVFKIILKWENWYKDLPTSFLLHVIQYQRCKRRLALLAR